MAYKLQETIYFLQMSALRVESLELPSDGTEYLFKVYNTAEGTAHKDYCFANSGWQASHIWKYEIGTYNEICQLINPTTDDPSANPSDICDGMDDWQFTITVRDGDGNESPETDKVSIPVSEFPDCIVLGTYTELEVCSPDGVPADECNTDDNKVLVFQNKDAEYDTQDKIYLLTSDIAEKLPELPLIIQHDSKCYSLTEDSFVLDEVPYYLKLNQFSYDYFPYLNPSCTCDDDCFTTYVMDNPSQCIAEETQLDDANSFYLSQIQSAHYPLTDNRDSTDVFEYIGWVNGTASRFTNHMSVNPSSEDPSGEDDTFGMYFDGAVWVDCSLRLFTQDDRANPSLVPPDYYNPSVPVEPDDPSDYVEVIPEPYTDEEFDDIFNNPSLGFYEEDVYGPSPYDLDFRFYFDRTASYTLWFKGEASGAILSDGGNDGFTLYFSAESNELQIIDNTITSNVVVAATGINTDQWYHICLIFNTGNNPSALTYHNLYIDNQLKAEFDYEFFDSDNNPVLGKNALDEYFTGWISDFRIYANNELTEEARGYIYNGGVITHEIDWIVYESSLRDCSREELITNLDDYNNCVDECIDAECWYIETDFVYVNPSIWDMPNNPSDWGNDNPSAADYILVYKDCRACWHDVTDLPFNYECVNVKEPVSLLECISYHDLNNAYQIANHQNNFTFTNINTLDLTFPLQISNINTCEALAITDWLNNRSCQFEGFIPVWETTITVIMTVFSGDLELFINGYKWSSSATDNWNVRSDGLKHRTFRFSPDEPFALSQEQGTYDLNGVVDPTWWLPYLEIKNQTDDCDFRMSYYCSCESRCSNETPTLVLPMQKCDCQDEQLRKWIIKDFIRPGESFWKYKDVCYRVNSTLGNGIPIDSVLINNDNEVLNYNDNDYNNCFECVNEDWIDGRTIHYINTANGLQSMQDNLDDCYVMTSDIWLTGYDWTPVGSNLDRFTGRLDGQGHIIHNFTHDEPSLMSGASLFGWTYFAKIKNVGMDNVYINVRSNAAPFTTQSYYTEWINCFAKGEINLWSQGDTGGTGGYGFAGYIYRSKFLKCYAEVDINIEVTGNSSYGYSSGFVGNLDNDGNISFDRCYGRGTITVNGEGTGYGFNIGGFTIDDNNSGSIPYHNCFANVDIYISGVSSANGIGQFMAEGELATIGNEGNFTNCHGNGNIVGATVNIGGFTARAFENTAYTHCYFDDSKTNNSDYTYDVTPLTSAQFRNKSSFVGWNIGTSYSLWIMHISGAYPELRKFGGEFIGDGCDSEILI